jgi:hypothetical protein
MQSGLEAIDTCRFDAIRRDRIVEKIEKTMKADITEEECEKLNTAFQQPKIVISMVPQIISNMKYNNTKSIALEIRVPATHENVYLNILDRLNKRASTLQNDEVVFYSTCVSYDDNTY